MNFHQIFSVGLPSEDLKFITFLFPSSNNCCHVVNTLKVFGILKILNCPLHKPMHGYSRKVLSNLSWAGVSARGSWLFFTLFESFLFFLQVNVTLRKPGTRLEHQGIKIEFVGQIGK